MGFISGVGKVLKGIGKTGINAIEGIGEGSLFGAEKIGSALINNSLSAPGKVALGTLSGAAIGGILGDMDDNSDPVRSASTGALVGLGAGVLGVSGAMSTLGVGALGATMTGVKGVSLFGSAMLKAPDKSIKMNLGNVGEYKLSKLAVPVLMGSALLSGLGNGLKTFEKSRMGTNDGILRTATPDINIQNDVYGVLGNDNSDTTPAYARNAGATGDLVFAMYNGTH